LETAVKAKMLTFVLPIQKRLMVLFWTYFNISATKAKLERTETSKNFGDAEASF